MQISKCVCVCVSECVCLSVSICISRDTLHTPSCLSSSHVMPDIIQCSIPKAMQSTSVTPTPSSLITHIQTHGPRLTRVFTERNQEGARVSQSGLI